MRGGGNVVVGMEGLGGGLLTVAEHKHGCEGQLTRWRREGRKE
jgi:hypothetical protein